MSNEHRHFYEFGGFRLDSKKRILWQNGEIVPITPKAAEVLLSLVEKRGDLLEREELLDRVWKDTFVEEANLNFTIANLRKVLGQNGKKMIQTVPRRGYRFTEPIEDIYEENSDRRVIEKEPVTNSEIPKEAPDIEPRLADVPPARANRTILIGAVAVLAVLLGGWIVYRNWNVRNPPLQTSARPITSLAVLPLKSFDKADTNAELRLRITDALITKLGRMKEVAVRPTNSILRFTGGEPDIVTAGKELDVEAVLDGRVQHEADRLRVTIQLVSVETGVQLWSGQFDGREGQILDLQDAISHGLRGYLAVTETDDRTRPYTEVADAYEAYLKGRYFWNQRTPDAYLKAIEFFQEAVRLDPNFALAYSGIADSYGLLNRRFVGSSVEALPQAEEAARKAIELDDSLAEAHNSMGLVRSVYNRNWQESEDHYRKAIELNPNYAIARAWFGLHLSARGRFDEAETQLRMAERLDPTSRNIAVYMALNFYQGRKFDRAIEQARRALELDPKLSSAYLYLSQSFEQKGMLAEAVEAELERQKVTAPEAVEPLRTAFLQSGIKGFWRKQVEVKKEQAVKYSTCQYEIATRYVLLDARNEALKMIEENYFSGGTCWNSLKTEPAFDKIREEPRYKEVVSKMGL